MSLLLSKGITLVLRRTGLSISNGDLQDRARDYLGLSLSELVNDGTQWKFLDITDTFTTVSGTRDYTPIATNVASWVNFVDQSNGRPLDIIGSNEYDSIDPELDDSGTIEKVYVGGIDGTAQENEISLWRTPSNSSTVIRYRYLQDIQAWSSANDASTFLQLGVPRIVEKAILHGAASMYLEETGDLEMADRESQRYARAYAAARAYNGAQQGNRQYLPIRNRGGEEYTINISTDQVSV